MSNIPIDYDCSIHPPEDIPKDITKAQCEQFGLIPMVYFMHENESKRCGTEYVYYGLRYKTVDQGESS